MTTFTAADALAPLHERIRADERRIVVLDDDPTGTQSMSGLPVLLEWEPEDFTWAFASGAPAVYVMTNSRSLDADAAEQRLRAVMRAARAAAGDRPLVFVSRADSTLRGHFPLETDVIADERVAVDYGDRPTVVLVPAFPEAGRVTVHGVHELVGGDGVRTPVGETEFARDATFGFRASALPEWVAERTAGAVPAESVRVVDLATVRRGPEAVAHALLAGRGAVVVLDAETDADVRSGAEGVDLAERAGARLVLRVAPSFMRGRLGDPDAIPVDDASLGARDGATRGGLVVVGSHVSVTQRQLTDFIAACPDVPVVEVDAASALAWTPAQAVAHAERIVDALGRGNVVLQTSRVLHRDGDPTRDLAIARAVSAALVDVVACVIERVRPRFVVAKGGITSSDVAARALGIRRAEIVGPMLPGLTSLWRSGGAVDAAPQ